MKKHGSSLSAPTGGLLAIPTAWDADALQRHLVRHNRMALGLLVVVFLLIGGMMHTILSASISHDTLVNTAGRQRMLSQRIIFLAHQAYDNVSPTDRVELLQAVRQLQASHQMVMEEVQRPRGWWEGENTLMPVYREGPMYLEALMSRFVMLGKAIAADAAVSDAEYTEIQELGATRLLFALEEMVRRVIALNHEKIMHQGMMALALLLVAIVTIAAVAFWIFRPAMRTVRLGQERLAYLNQLKQGFLSTVSHEMRTPMNTIFGMAERLQEGGLTLPQQQQVAHLLHAAENLLVLLDDLLDLSRLEAGKLELDQVPFDVVQLLEEVAEKHATTARAKQLEVMVHFAPTAPRMLVGDPNRLRQMLGQLMSNAIQYTVHGSVQLAVALGDGTALSGGQQWIDFRVEDTGAGIPADKQRAIFECFTRGTLADQNGERGMGLGLAIVHKLAMLMGGVVGLESEPGKGSLFRVRVPLTEAPQNAAPSLDAAACLKGKRLLVVDDMAANREQLAYMLSSANAQVVLASGAQEALQCLRADDATFDAIISDYLMPGMDGEALCRELQADARTAHLPIIIVSSAGELGFASRFTGLGAAAFLAKPLRTPTFLATVASAIEGRKALSRNLSRTEARPLVQRAADGVDPLQDARVLLVEDNRINREFTSEILAKLGCQVATAEHGEAAIARVVSTSYDLILMDCQMPVMDGFEATRRIRTFEMEAGRGVAVPIIALTANTMAGDRERCLAAGMNDYLTKPIRQAMLESMLRRWITHIPHDVSLPLYHSPLPRSYDYDA